MINPRFFSLFSYYYHLFFICQKNDIISQLNINIKLKVYLKFLNQIYIYYQTTNTKNITTHNQKMKSFLFFSIIHCTI